MKLFSRVRISRQQFERIWLLAKIDYKIRFYENKLGMAWAMVKPLSDMGIYYIVFGIFLNKGVPGYHLYLFLGLIFWNLFAENTTGKIFFLQEKKYLYEYSNMNKWEIYSSSILSSFIGLLFNLSVFVIFLLVDNLFFHRGYYISWHIVCLPLFFIFTYFICLAFSVILSSVYVVIRDVHQIWQVIFGVLFWVSPVVYDVGLYQKYAFAVFLHPMAGIIMGVRSLIFNHVMPSGMLFLAIVVNIVVYTLIAVFCFNRYGKLAAEKL